ncbi:hypothetical protein EM595_2422 [Duffyella gerundensis]|uniref:Uncharacterized protein n=1 Tax=Duffyella gerundensis TaxID=1619313 RepID=A0A0U5L3Y6_9GAMM|nr:hypothetical protein EM595_2422 [Duffyella gerundensis]
MAVDLDFKDLDPKDVGLKAPAPGQNKAFLA